MFGLLGSLQNMAIADILSQKYPKDLETELSAELKLFTKFFQTSSVQKLASSQAGKTRVGSRIFEWDEH